MKRKNLGYGSAEKLADVMALIQALAVSQYRKLTEDELLGTLRRKPLDRPNWIESAEHHPEFFRVGTEPDSENPTLVYASLVARSAMPKGADNLAPALPSDHVGKLLDIAISLHDREIVRGERWKTWLPVAAAIIAGLFTVAAAILKTDSDAASQSSPAASHATPNPVVKP